MLYSWQAVVENVIWHRKNERKADDWYVEELMRRHFYHFREIVVKLRSLNKRFARFQQNQTTDLCLKHLIKWRIKALQSQRTKEMSRYHRLKRSWLKWKLLIDMRHKYTKALTFSRQTTLRSFMFEWRYCVQSTYTISDFYKWRMHYLLLSYFQAWVTVHRREVTSVERLVSSFCFTQHFFILACCCYIFVKV